MKEKIKLLDAFAGVGALHMALKRNNIDVNLVGLSEIDVDAIINYAAIHKTDEFEINDFEFPSIGVSSGKCGFTTLRVFSPLIPLYGKVIILDYYQII